MKTKKIEPNAVQMENHHTGDDDVTRLSVRLTDKTEQMIEELQEMMQIPVSSIVRFAITKLYKDMEEKL